MACTARKLAAGCGGGGGCRGSSACVACLRSSSLCLAHRAVAGEAGHGHVLVEVIAPVRADRADGQGAGAAREMRKQGEQAAAI